MRRACNSGAPARLRGWRAGFTLLELMIAILVASLAMAIAIPALSGAARRDPLTGALNGLLDAFHEARSRAVLEGVSMQVVIRPFADHTEVAVEPAPIRNPDRTAPMAPIEATPAGGGTGEAPAPRLTKPFQMSFAAEVAFRTLVVNTHDMMNELATAVRFHPNGTCDQFDGILRWPGHGERHITLEVTTGLAEVEDVR